MGGLEENFWSGGRGGEIPSPGTGGFGDLGLESALHALRHKASVDFWT